MNHETSIQREKFDQFQKHNKKKLTETLDEDPNYKTRNPASTSSLSFPPTQIIPTITPLIQCPLQCPHRTPSLPSLLCPLETPHKRPSPSLALPSVGTGIIVRGELNIIVRVRTILTEKMLGECLCRKMIRTTWKGLN